MKPTIKTTVSHATEVAEAWGHKILAAVQYPNPADSYLAKVICKSGISGEYVIWTFNVTDKGFHNGRYFKEFADCFGEFSLLISELILH